jgi:hypothetical protein
MTSYADQARLRPGAAGAAAASRFSIARRPAADVAMNRAVAGGEAGSVADGVSDTSAGEDDSASAFDVPAFLRRQEG